MSETRIMKQFIAFAPVQPRNYAIHKIAFCLAGLLAGCGSVPPAQPYQRPALQLPGAMLVGAAAPGQTDVISGGADNVDWMNWWKAFQDPVLDGLMNEAASNSQDLALAAGRIAEARAMLAQNESSLYPTVDFNAGASRRRASENSATFGPTSKPYSNDRQLGLSASYEIDFWGRYARADDAARARLLAQTASRGAVLTTLYANVAQSYFLLRGLDAQFALAEKTLLTRQETLRLQQKRLKGGVVGELDLHQAESEAASAQATLLVTQQNRSNAESALALLVGRSPASIASPVLERGLPLDALASRAVIPAGLPSDVLTRRPDIVSAEQNLIAANADIAQARTAYFPRLSLTASVGLQSKDLSDLFEPASLFWNLLGNLTQPIFRAGAIDATVAATNARQQQAVAQYTQTVQSAFRDVHDALNNLSAGRNIAATSAQRIEALRQTLRLAELRYKNGYSSYLEVLNAQRDLAQAESGLVDTQRSQMAAVVSLYKAVGGGWDSAGAH